MSQGTSLWEAVEKRMGRKIFISYKYWDDNVFPGVPAMIKGACKVRDYVNWLEDRFMNHSDHISKAEHDNEDLSNYSEEFIWERLKDKIYDSSVTIVLISPGMKMPRRWERSQWIPWEVEYSLRLVQRKDRTSRRNALLGVVLPDRSGNYDYYSSQNLFRILRKNIDNGYMEVVAWDDFRYNRDKYIDRAIERSKRYEPELGI